MSKNNYYAYIIEDKNKGITDSWDVCKDIITGKRAKYKGFKTQQEAKDWIAGGGEYNYKAVLKDNLKPGIYFDAGTGRGIGVEVKVTDEKGTNILNRLLPDNEINSYGNYLAPKGSTNNYGELMGCYIALKIALAENKKYIFGDSKLIIDYWSKGAIKRDTVAPATVKLAMMVVTLRREFEQQGGRIEHVSGDINPADLGFHR